MSRPGVADGRGPSGEDSVRDRLPSRGGSPGRGRDLPDVSAAQVRRDLERVLRQVGDERTARVAWARLAEPEDPAVVQLVSAAGALGALHGLDSSGQLAR